jgi:hypothetical protein
MLPITLPIAPRVSGQWTGQLFGETPALAVLDLEQDESTVHGTAYMYPQDFNIVPALVRFSFPAPLSNQHFVNLPVMPFAPEIGAVITRDQMRTLYPNSDVSDSANITISFAENTAFVTIDAALTKGFGNLTKGHTEPSRLASIPMTWDQFKTQSTTWTKQRFVYRGQSDPWRLRTSFHRTWRKNLDTYTSLLVRDVHRALAAHLDKPLDFTKPDDIGSFYSMIQHHGYPTPLLDWTNSPFVAAFFAFENAAVSTEKSVRIIAFDRVAWTVLEQNNRVSLARPHLSFVDLLPYGNFRAGPQKSEFTLTNIDDIENHIVGIEIALNQRYLYAIDIPTTERERVLSDLEIMGIDHASLFPGMDGTCKAMRRKHFGC